MALAAYLPGIWWGLPEGVDPDRIAAWGPDELAPVGHLGELARVLGGASEGFNPQYPLFHHVISAIFSAPYLGWLWLTGGLEGFAPLYPFGLEDPARSLATLTLFARLPSALSAAAAVVAAYLTAGELWGRRAGAFAAAAALLIYPTLYYGRTSNVDAGALAWTAFGLFLFVRILRRGLNIRRAAALGLVAALATATKDASYAPFVTAGVLVAVRHLRSSRDRGVPWRRAAVPLSVGAAAAVAAYAVASGLVLHPGRFAAHVAFVVQGSGGAGDGASPFYFRHPATVAGYAAVLLEAGRHLVDALGVPLVVASALGLGLAAARRDGSAWVAVAALAILPGVILPVRFAELRFLLVPAWALALYAGYALSVAGKGASRRVRWAGAAAAVLVLGFGAVRGTDLTIQMLRDSRYAAGAWLRANAEAGERVGYYGAALKLPRLGPELRPVPMPGQPGVPTPEDGVFRPEWVIVIPQQAFEPAHEWTMPASVWRALRDGSMGYREVAAFQGPRLFERRPVSFVNPPVRVWARSDVAPRVAGAEASAAREGPR